GARQRVTRSWDNRDRPSVGNLTDRPALASFALISVGRRGGVPVWAAENGGLGHGERTHGAVGLTVPLVLADGAQNALGDVHSVATRGAGHARSALVLYAIDEIVQFVEQRVA